MPNAGMRALVPPIIGEPSPNGRLGGCVPVVTTIDAHHLNGTDMVATGCTGAHPWQDCPTTTSGEFPWTNPVAKIFDPVTYCTFEPFTAYAGIECSAVGTDFAEMAERAEQALILGEQYALENWFMTRFLANATHTVDLTPGAGAVHIVNGIGILENWLGANYGGKGVIHAPIGTASLLSMHHQVDESTEESCPQTLARNSVVIGAGYSANVGPATPPAVPAVAPTGEAWLYITPPMRIRRDNRTMTINREMQGFNTAVNDRQSLFETTFVPEVACCKAAAVRVSLSACC